MKTLSVIPIVILILHGLIHLMGTVTYMKLGVVEGLTYKTTLLDGRWELARAASVSMARCGRWEPSASLPQRQPCCLGGLGGDPFLQEWRRSRWL